MLIVISYQKAETVRKADGKLLKSFIKPSTVLVIPVPRLSKNGAIFSDNKTNKDILNTEFYKSNYTT